MDKTQIINDLENLLTGNPWGLNDRLRKFIEELKTSKVAKQRTIPQNNAIHLWLSWVADELNNQGQTLQNVVAKIRRAEIRPTVNSLKEVVWRPYQMAAIHDKNGKPKESTTQLAKHEVTIVYEGLNKFFSQEFQIGIPFPSQLDMETWESKARELKVK